MEWEIHGHWSSDCPCCDSCHTCISVELIVCLKSTSLCGGYLGCQSFFVQDPRLNRKTIQGSHVSFDLLLELRSILLGRSCSTCTWMAEGFGLKGYHGSDIFRYKFVEFCAAKLWLSTSFTLFSPFSHLLSVGEESPGRGGSVTRLRSPRAHFPPSRPGFLARPPVGHSPDPPRPLSPPGRRTDPPPTQTWPLGSADTLSYIGLVPVWNPIEVTFPPIEFSSFLLVLWPNSVTGSSVSPQPYVWTTLTHKADHFPSPDCVWLTLSGRKVSLMVR